MCAYAHTERDRQTHVTSAEVALIVTATASLITSVGGIVGLFFKMEAVQKSTDGMKNELVDEVRKASFAKGEKSATDNAPPPAT
jgi:hypothetical protein